MSFPRPQSGVFISLWLRLVSHKSEFADPMKHDSQKFGYCLLRLPLRSNTISLEDTTVCIIVDKERSHCHNAERHKKASRDDDSSEIGRQVDGRRLCAHKCQTRPPLQSGMAFTSFHTLFCLNSDGTIFYSNSKKQQ